MKISVTPALALSLLVSLHCALSGCGNDLPTPDSREPAVHTATAEDLGERCELAAIQLRSRFEREHAIEVRPPFILAGDLSPSELAKHYNDSILPATRALQRQFFNTAINRPTTVLLFANQSTYRDFVTRWHPSSDHAKSVYGYYQPTEQTLVVNLAAGEGTIVHELVHAMIQADFPDAPLWFNEGMASLFEHSRLVTSKGESHLTPLHNWRLRVLQQGIASGQLNPIRDLVVTTKVQRKDEALFYSHARYFCFYLYELGHLEEFYAGYRNNSESPQTLKVLTDIAPDLQWNNWDRNFRKWATNQRLKETEHDDAAIHRLIKE